MSSLLPPCLLPAGVIQYLGHPLVQLVDHLVHFLGGIEELVHVVSQRQQRGEMAALAHGPAQVVEFRQARPKADAELLADIMGVLLRVDEQLQQGHPAGRFTQGHDALLSRDLEPQRDGTLHRDVGSAYIWYTPGEIAGSSAAEVFWPAQRGG